MSETELSLQPEWLYWPQTQKLIAALKAEEGERLRFVGGAVRDSIIGKAVHDVDAATTLQPAEVMSRLQEQYIQVIPTGLAHGTITARIEERTFEITTLRKDMSCDGRHAEVAYTESWEEDAKRRDFTMNALYMDAQGRVYDYCGGIDDAKAGHVRFIGDAHARVEEDYLRILRFYRFYAYYGSGEADSDARAACMAHAQRLPKISGERVQQELLKLLASDHAPRAIQLMDQDGVMAYVLGLSIQDIEIFARIQEIEKLGVIALTPEEKLAAFALATGEEADFGVKRLAERLKLSKRLRNGLLSWLPYVSQVNKRLPLAEQKHLLRMLGAQAFCAMICMGWAASEDAISKDEPYIKMLKLAQSWKPPIFPVTGSDLMQAGIPPGRVMGDMMRSLQDAWEHSDYKLSKDDLLKKAHSLQGQD